MTHLLTDETSMIPKEQWDLERIGHACLSEEDFGWLRATLEKACSELKNMCDLKTKKAMKQFFERADRVASLRKRDK